MKEGEDEDENEVFEYYLLDCEGLGFCDYVRLENPTKEEAYMEEERLMGGLGENRIFISEDRALFLIQYFGRKNIEYEKPLPEGEEYAHKCLPVVLKNYKPQTMPRIIIYAGDDFGIFSVTDFAKLYALCNDGVRKRLYFIFEKL